MLGHDEKRLHVFHALHRTDDDALLATAEQMLLHVDTAAGRAASAAPAVLDRVARLAAAHAALPRPSARAARSPRRDEHHADDGGEHAGPAAAVEPLAEQPPREHSQPCQAQRRSSPSGRREERAAVGSVVPPSRPSHSGAAAVRAAVVQRVEAARRR